MSPSFGDGRGGRKFRYYAANTPGPRRPDQIRRVSARQLEQLIIREAGRLITVSDFDPWPAILQTVARVEIHSKTIHLVFHGSGPPAIGPGSVPQDMDMVRDAAGTTRAILQVRAIFRGGRTWLVGGEGVSAASGARVDEVLVTALRKAHACACSHSAWPSANLASLANAKSPADSYARSFVRLAFLAPDIQQAIVKSRHPPGLTLQELLRADIPTAWVDQRVELGFAICAAR